MQLSCNLQGDNKRGKKQGWQGVGFLSGSPPQPLISSSFLSCPWASVSVCVFVCVSAYTHTCTKLSPGSHWEVPRDLLNHCRLSDSGLSVPFPQHTHTHTHTHTHAHTHSLSLTHTLSLSLSLSHTHTPKRTCTWLKEEGKNIQVCFVCLKNLSTLSPFSESQLLCSQLLHLFHNIQPGHCDLCSFLLHWIFFLDHTQSQRGMEAPPNRWCQTLEEHIITWPYQATLPDKAPSIVCLQAAQSPGAWWAGRSALSRMWDFFSCMQWYDQVPWCSSFEVHQRIFDFSAHPLELMWDEDRMGRGSMPTKEH